ncbi:MAG: hypothetical protein ABIE55_01845 [Candidatus Aenigmatarchaeota archaeon]
MKRGISTESKTVGEILKEQGVIRDRPEKEEEKKPEYKLEKDDDLKKVIMNMEKFSVEIKNLKEVKFQADERIRELTEKIGELRSLVFQRESSIKEMESKIKFIEDAVSGIEPKRITKEMDKRRAEIEDKAMKIERLEAMNKEMLNKLRNVEKVTDNIKSMENMESILDKVNETVRKNENTKSDIDRMASKSEKFYMEMDNRLKEFPGFKMKLDKVDDMSKELMKSVDGMNIRLTAFASKQDLEAFKRGVDNVIASNLEKTEDRIREVEGVLKVPVKEIVTKKNELKSKRTNVSKLLADIEAQHREGKLSERSFNEVKVKNFSLLKKLDEEIEKLEGEEEFSTKPLPSLISEMKDGMSKLEDKIQTLEGEEIGITLKTQTEVVRNMLSKLKEVSKKLSRNEMKINFFEILNMIMRTENVRDITFLMSELDKTVSEMKIMELWDSMKESLVKGLLMDVSDAWRDYGYNDIADVFAEGLNKIVGSSNTGNKQIETIMTEESPKQEDIEVY